ncbi:MAG TPA: TonB family protein [Kofleriaceae bacterium]|nr:TonB family protein [Kofleriaceae bacterium]
MGTHLAVAGGLFASGVWQIERLHADARARTDLGQPLAPPAPAASVAAAKLPEIKRKEQKRVVKESVQPPTTPQQATPTTTEVSETPGSGEGSGGADAPGTCVENCGEPHQAAPVCGDGSRDAGEQCDDGNTAAGDGCSPTCQIEVKPRPATRAVAPSVLQGLRMSGETQLHPSASTQSQMVHDEVHRVTGTVKLCVSTDGGVSSAAMLRPTGYAAYDATLLSAVRAWRYRPYMVGDTPVPACSTVTFIYSIE